MGDSESRSLANVPCDGHQPEPVMNADDSTGADVLHQCEIAAQRQKVCLQCNDRYRAFFENANDMIQSVDGRGRFLDVNYKWMEILGYTRDEVAEMTVWDILRSDQIDHCVDVFQRVIAGEKASGIRTVFVSRAGDAIEVEGNASCIHTENGDVVTVGVFRDITYRQQMGDCLQASEERYRTIFDSVPVSLVVVDIDGRINDINSNHIAQIGKNRVTKDDFIGKQILDHPSIVQAGLADLYRRALNGEVVHEEDVYFPAVTGGKYGRFNVKAVPLMRDGELTGVVFIHEDITERRGVEDKLRQNEAEYHSILTNMTDIVMKIDRKGTILFVNWLYEGLTHDYVLGKTIYDFIPEERTSYSRARLRQVFEDGQTVTYEIQGMGHYHGSLFYQLRIVPVWENGAVIAAIYIISDITERKQAEAWLAEKLAELERYKSITVGRELKMVELKQRVKELENELGRNAAAGETDHLVDQ